MNSFSLLLFIIIKIKCILNLTIFLETIEYNDLELLISIKAIIINSIKVLKKNLKN